MRIVIVGAGLAGLSAYWLLRAEGHEVRLVERAEWFGRKGYGIVLWGDDWHALRQLGIGDVVSNRGVPAKRWEVRDARGRVLNVLGSRRNRSRDAATPELANLSFGVVHRADLHEALRAGLPDADITMGAGVRDIRQDSDGATVTLTDGSSERADLVVGADGVHSPVRTCVLGTEPRDLESAVWSFWVPDRVELPDGFTELWGHDGKSLLVGGIAGKRMATLDMPVPRDAVVGDPLAYLRARAGEWVLPQLLEAVAEAGEDVFFDRVRAVNMRRFHRGRVALVGDAAHAVHPIVGQGASLALQDARVLAEQLGGAAAQPREAGEVYAALDGFTRRRRGPVRRAHLEAAVAQRFILAKSPAAATVRNFVTARTSLLERFFLRQAPQPSGRVRTD